MKEFQYFVYSMTNHNHTVLYTGVTNNLIRRVIERGTGKSGEFMQRYKVYKLVYDETGDDINIAMYREKQIKTTSQKKKI
jgi:putative endonuclease